MLPHIGEHEGAGVVCFFQNDPEPLVRPDRPKPWTALHSLKVQAGMRRVLKKPAHRTFCSLSLFYAQPRPGFLKSLGRN